MGHPSPKYTAEFKQRAVELYRERGCTYAELARELGCDAGGISDWVRRADASGAAPDRNPFQMAEEPRGATAPGGAGGRARATSATSSSRG